MSENKQNSKRLDWIDALRGIAAFFVVLWHTTEGRLENHHIRVFPYLASLAVPLFFSISGFSIFLTLHRDLIEKEPPKNIIRYYFSFLIRRFLKIAPLYYVALFVFSPLLFMVLSVHFPPSFYDWINFFRENAFSFIIHFFFLHAFSESFSGKTYIVLWTLTAEVVFYILSPFLFFLVFRWKNKLASFLIAIVLLFSVSPIQSFLSPLFASFHLTLNNTLGQLGSVCFGFIIFLFYKNYSHLTQSVLSKWLGTALFFIALAPFYVTDYHLSEKINSLLLLLFSFFLFPNNPLVNRFFIYIGQLGYSIYLVHMLIKEFVLRFFKYIPLYPNNLNADALLLLNFVIILIITTLISIPLQKYIVEPGVRYGSKLGKKILLRGETQIPSNVK